MARFTRKGGRKTRKMRKSHTRKRIKIQFGGSAEKEKVDGLLTTIVQNLKSKKYDKLVYEKDIYELFDSIVILLSQTDQVSQDMYKQIAFINANNISGDENVNKLIIFMSQLLSRRLEPPGYVKKQIPKDLLNNIDSIFAKYKNLCDCVEQIKPCDVEELANSINKIYEPRTTIKKNIENLETHVKDNYDDMQIYITLSGFVKFHKTLDEWRKSLKRDEPKVTRMVELLKPIVDKYSFLVPRTFLVVQLIETELDELFVKKPESKKPESKKPESKKPESEKPESKKPESKKPESKKPESKKPESKKPESKEPESKKPESKKPESKKPENKEEPKPKEGGRKVEDTISTEMPQINYVKGIPSEKRQKKLEEREMKLMEEAENAEKSRLKIEQAAKEQAAKELEAKQQASKQVAVKNYIFAEIDPINKKIKTYSDEINQMLASANYADTTFDTLMKIDIEQLYSTIQSNFGAFAEFFDREDGKFKYMFNYEPDIEQQISFKKELSFKQEYKKAQCMLLFTIGYLNNILSKSGVDYAKYILKGGGAMKLRLAEILAGKQTDPLFFSNDIDVKSYLNPTKFAKVVDPNFLRIYQFGLSLIISKIFNELTIRDLMMLKFFPERSILKLSISFLEPDTQPLETKLIDSGSKTPVFKISLDSGMKKIIPIADIDPSPTSIIGIPTTQDSIVDIFKSQELKFYVDNFSEFVDDKIKYYKVYYDAYSEYQYDDYVLKTFKKFLKYINLFIKLMKIEETLFNKEQNKILKQIEEQKDLEKIEEKLQQIEEKLKKQMEENLKRQSSKPYAVQSSNPYAVQSSNPYAVQSSNPYAVQSSYPYAVQSPYPYAVQSPYPYAVQSPYPYAVQSPYPYAVQSPYPQQFQPPQPPQPNQGGGPGP
jgi:outer membrane biosynthesis protein TonB